MIDSRFRVLVEDPPPLQPRRRVHPFTWVLIVAALVIGVLAGCAPEPVAEVPRGGVVRYLDVTFRDVPDVGTKGRRIRYVCAPQIEEVRK